MHASARSVSSPSCSSMMPSVLFPSQHASSAWPRYSVLPVSWKREKKWPRSRAHALRLWHELYDAHVANATGRALEDVVDLLSAGPRCKRRPRPAPR